MITPADRASSAVTGADHSRFSVVSGRRESNDSRYGGIGSPAATRPKRAECTATTSCARASSEGESVPASKASYRTPVYSSRAGMVGDRRIARLRSTSLCCLGPSFRARMLASRSRDSSVTARSTARRVFVSDGNRKLARSSAPPTPPSFFVSDGGRRMST